MLHAPASQQTPLLHDIAPLQWISQVEPSGPSHFGFPSAQLVLSRHVIAETGEMQCKSKAMSQDSFEQLIVQDSVALNSMPFSQALSALHVAVQMDASQRNAASLHASAEHRKSQRPDSQLTLLQVPPVEQTIVQEFPPVHLSWSHAPEVLHSMRQSLPGGHLTSPSHSPESHLKTHVLPAQAAFPVQLALHMLPAVSGMSTSTPPSLAPSAVPSVPPSSVGASVPPSVLGPSSIFERSSIPKIAAQATTPLSATGNANTRTARVVRGVGGRSLTTSRVPRGS